MRSRSGSLVDAVEGEEPHAVGWYGSAVRRCSTRSSSLKLGLVLAEQLDPPRGPHLGDARRGALAVSTVSGRSPSRPRITARSLPCPCPVAPSEPNSSARTRATWLEQPVVASPVANVRAARIGPTVCEDDGPMPMVNRSKRADGHEPSWPL